MAVPDTFQATVTNTITATVVAGTSVRGLPELTAFRNALADIASATRADRLAAWHAAYTPTATGPSLVQQLRKAIRDVINAQADSEGTLSPLERESMYRTLVAEFAPSSDRPQTDDEEYATLQQLLRADQLS